MKGWKQSPWLVRIKGLLAQWLERAPDKCAARDELRVNLSLFWRFKILPAPNRVRDPRDPSMAQEWISRDTYKYRPENKMRKRIFFPLCWEVGAEDPRPTYSPTDACSSFGSLYSVFDRKARLSTVSLWALYCGILFWKRDGDIKANDKKDVRIVY